MAARKMTAISDYITEFRLFVNKNTESSECHLVGVFVKELLQSVSKLVEDIVKVLIIFSFQNFNNL